MKLTTVIFAVVLSAVTSSHTLSAPKGVRLYDDRIGESSSHLFLWGTDKQELREAIGAGKSASTLACLPSSTIPEIETCVTGCLELTNAHWYADLGQGRRSTTAVDFYKGKLFRFTVLFDERDFDFFLNTMREGIGAAPTRDDISIVENMLGVKFRNRIAVWVLEEEDIIVTLQQRANKVTEGALNVYVASMEIEANSRANPAGRSPFQ